MKKVLPGMVLVFLLGFISFSFVKAQTSSSWTIYYDCNQIALQSTTRLDLDSLGYWHTYIAKWCDNQQTVSPIVYVTGNKGETTDERGKKKSKPKLVDEYTLSFVEEIWDTTTNTLDYWFEKQPNDNIVYYHLASTQRISALNTENSNAYLQFLPSGLGCTVSYKLTNAERVFIRVFDGTGNIVATLVDEEQGAGQHLATFDATSLSAGVYFVQAVVGLQTYSGKVLVTK